MDLDLFESKTHKAIESYVDRLAQRHKIVASNLANIDTPGYKTRDISFHATIDELLADRAGGNLRTTHERHVNDAPFDSSLGTVHQPEGLLERADKNNVDIDWEMTKLNETSFAYSMMTQFLRGSYQRLATSINEGRGGQ